MISERRLPGRVRDARGHRHAGGRLGTDERERHYIIAAIGIVAALASAYATYEATQAQAESLDYQAKVAKNQAQAARNAAEVAAEDQADQDEHILALQRARMGAAGISSDVGSPLLVQSESAATAELNRRRILWQGEQGARNFEADAILAGWESRSTRRLGYLQTGTTLLNAAAKIYGAYKTSGGGGGYGGQADPGYTRNRPPDSPGFRSR